MNVEKIERMYEIAERIVARSVIERTVFSEQHDQAPQDLVAALTEGWLRGRRFASWMPIAGAMYRDEQYRDMIAGRSIATWRSVAMNALVPMDWLAGPKGKLPA